MKQINFTIYNLIHTFKTFKNLIKTNMYGGSLLVSGVISLGFSVGRMLCVVAGGQVYPAAGGLVPGGAGGKAPKPGLYRPALS